MYSRSVQLSCVQPSLQYKFNYPIGPSNGYNSFIVCVCVYGPIKGMHCFTLSAGNSERCRGIERRGGEGVTEKGTISRGTELWRGER